MQGNSCFAQDEELAALSRQLQGCQVELSELQAASVQDVELAVGATGDPERLERDRCIREIADLRTLKLRSSSHRVAAEVALQVAQRIQQLMRFAIYECVSTDDHLFINGWLENPLVVRPPPQASAGNFASEEF